MTLKHTHTCTHIYTFNFSAIIMSLTTLNTKGEYDVAELLANRILFIDR